MRFLPFLLAVLLVGCGSSSDEPASSPSPTPSATASPSASAESTPHAREEVVATGLEVPWELVFLEDGRGLVTERIGRVRVLSRSGELQDVPLAEIDVDEAGEGGLMGMAVRGQDVFLYMTRGGVNQLVRYRLAGDELLEEEVLVDDLDASSIHSGGRLKFGPDDMLYLSVGDAANPSVAQDRDSLNGKILRVDPDSGDAEVYSYGHRNPQGFDWDSEGRMIASEHGQSGNDEINIIREGANYGWPEIEGEAQRDGMVTPIQLYQAPSAPSGATFWRGDFYVAMLRGERLQRLRIEGDEVVEDEALYEGEYGRLRTAVVGPDDALYLLTNNRDGRGDPREGDDKIIRINAPS